jgi:hypothetical protein
MWLPLLSAVSTAVSCSLVPEAVMEPLPETPVISTGQLVLISCWMFWANELPHNQVSFITVHCRNAFPDINNVTDLGN